MAQCSSFSLSLGGQEAPSYPCGRQAVQLLFQYSNCESVVVICWWPLAASGAMVSATWSCSRCKLLIDLRIGCESISSEWTTDSEAERLHQEQLGSRGIIEAAWAKGGRNGRRGLS